MAEQTPAAGHTAGTPAPWIVSDDFTIEAGPGSPAEPMEIAVVSDSSRFPCLADDEYEKADDEARANAARIVASVNALSMLTVDAIEQIQPMDFAHWKLMAARIRELEKVVEMAKSPERDAFDQYDAWHERLRETATAALSPAPAPSEEEQV